VRSIKPEASLTLEEFVNGAAEWTLARCNALRQRGKATIGLCVAQSLRGARLHRSGEVRRNASL
jgi:hypothetical protein